MSTTCDQRTDRAANMPEFAAHVDSLASVRTKPCRPRDVSAPGHTRISDLLLMSGLFSGQEILHGPDLGTTGPTYKSDLLPIGMNTYPTQIFHDEPERFGFSACHSDSPQCHLSGVGIHTEDHILSVSRPREARVVGNVGIFRTEEFEDVSA